ncbi:hypothetical protein ACMD2_11842 [Ananas comosus]|uniref:Uncharacterized protein n=1 Tax=Ananas comosus TaxID=4615 RepID=A0A199V059_ANACO|nr:hypothetical protein ACMD2_11842 [Ananas comosus]
MNWSCTNAENGKSKLMEIGKPTWKDDTIISLLTPSEDRAAIHNDPFGRGTRREVAVLAGGPPPVEALVLHRHRKVEQHPHHRHPRVQPCRQDVVVPLPPLLPVPVHEEVEHRPDRRPRRVVYCSSRRHIGSCTKKHGKVYQGDPRLLGEDPVEGPDDDRADSTAKEEPIERAVIAQRAEDAARAHQAPDDGRVKEDAVTGARPRAVGREEVPLADVGDRAQEPPCHAYEHGFGRDLHVMAELEIGKEGDGLRHAHVTVDLEAHVGDRLSRQDQTHARSGNGRESEAVGYSKEQTQVYPPLLTVRSHIDLKLVVDDGIDIILLASSREQIRGENWESLCIVEVEPPVCHRHDYVENQEIADEDIDDGEEGGGDGAPVEGESTDAEPVHAGAELLRRYGLGPGPADPRDARNGREEVARNDVPREAADQNDDEEFGPRHAAVFFLV